MASPPLLDFASLVKPVSAENPAGQPVSYLIRQEFGEARKEEEPHPDDPTQGAVPKKADWAGIVRRGVELLTGSSKDLLTAAQVTEALAKQHGLPGVRDGLHLLGDLVEQCWDRVHPLLEEGEGLEIRAGPFNWLSDVDRGARFPITVGALPLVKIDNHRFGWHDWKLAQEGRGPAPIEDFERAVLATETTAEDLAQALQEVSRLEAALDARMAEHAPGLIGLRQALEQCQHLVQIVQRRQGAAVPDTSGSPAQADGAAPAAALGQAVTSRDEAYRQLAQIAAVLERLEPHSPIPYLLRRAVELGKLPFGRLISEMVRDQSILAELCREFGVKQPSENSS